MLHRDKSKESPSARTKVSPPSSTYMNNEQFAAYLAGLRENRVNRPGGARPLPPSTRSRPGTTDQLSTTGRSSVTSDSIRPETPSSIPNPRPSSDLSKPRGSRPSIAGSVISRYSVNTASGKDYFPDQPAAAPLKPSEVVASATYIERGQRWMEKEEAFSLHQAMDAIEIGDEKKEEQAQDDETRIYNAALDEAAELVYQHEHGIKPREPDAPYRYKPHMRKNSYAHARTASVGRYGADIGPTGLARDSMCSPTRSSSGSDTDGSPGGERESADQSRFSIDSTNSKTPTATISGSRVPPRSRRRSSMRRNISGEIEKPFYGDQIWEEPESAASERSSKQSQPPDHSQVPQSKTRDSPGKVQFALDPSRDLNASPISAPAKLLSRTEIHRNPPSQSRNPNYTKNDPPYSPRTSQDIPKKNGIEIRSDDIRQATGMRLKDRSPKLPTPSAVSDSPGRPIVSFDKNWKAPEEAATDPKLDESRRGPFGAQKAYPGAQIPQPPAHSVVSTPDIPTSAASEAAFRRSAPVPDIQVESDDKPQIPMIAISDEGGPSVPTIALPDSDDNQSTGNAPNIPVIVTPDDVVSKPSARPLPDPMARPSHTRNAPSGGRSRGHWSPAPGAKPRSTATCHDCGYPIEGRFVALSGGSERFHPSCFRCYACGTSLEALEISPEPDNFREARLDRIRRRRAGELLEETPGQTMAEDGDERLRFYCHLDWHELFAPRCKHCKTPILGEHIVALGEHWHYGHFFCAECGDPFERSMTHIEKDGYAWCVACQTKRTERRAPKCKRCKRGVIGQYVKALGAEWHDECFRCATCGGGFDDGQIFPVGEGDQARVLCTGCRARELKN